MPVRHLHFEGLPHVPHLPIPGFQDLLDGADWYA